MAKKPDPEQVAELLLQALEIERGGIRSTPPPCARRRTKT